MITMVDKQTIIHLYRSRGLSKRAIARELDISRKTVQEAKDFAMRLAFEEFNLVKVMDTKRQELVRDFDAAIYREYTGGTRERNEAKPGAEKMLCECHGLDEN